MTSLTEVTEAYLLTVPPCAASTVRFAQYGRFSVDSLHPRIAGDDRCIADFLAANGLPVGPATTERGLPFVPEFGAEFGWPRDESRPYEVMGGERRGPHRIVDLLAAIDRDSEPRNLYLRAIIV